MALPIHIALTTDGSIKVGLPELTRVAAAIAKQVLRDFGPIWTVQATVDAFASLDDVPLDYWPIIVQRDVQGAAGYHEDDNGQPFALVEFEPEWSLTASHECLEMLADPFGRRMRAGKVPDQAIAAGAAGGRVSFLVEVCDPSEDTKYAYQVNGVTVSDFYTPLYFDPVAAPGVRYSFTGAIDAPRKVLDGGYLSWRDAASGHWFQLRMFPDNRSRKVPHVIDLTSDTVFARLLKRTNLREAIDRVTPRPKPGAEIARAPRLMAARKQGSADVDVAQKARAKTLRGAIRRLGKP
jgi:hypothetical protein